MPPEFQIDHVSVCLTQTVSSEENFLQYFESLEDISQHELSKKRVEKNLEDPLESYIQITDSSSGLDEPSPDSSSTQLLIDSISDGEKFHAHANIDNQDYIDSFNEFFSSISSTVGTLTAGTTIVNATVDEGFDAFSERLSLPISSDSEYTVRGIRINNGDGTYTFQDLSEFESEDDSIAVRYSKDELVKVDSEHTSDFIGEEISKVESFVGSESQ
ncbi:hypothetical protein [Halostagnicola kamekurae]|uniref:Uncharacterized protein n=1 Tax=Halostagnicola kamekurae TaxID=619731 RepID=A0A1I6TTY7_9EURY|nr:hypothetical protein [Halostagnicola kamekurae]SFS92645.1 hypothetical protein SAMN04488556_3431 [Halostagnicola kamekurae]